MLFEAAELLLFAIPAAASGWRGLLWLGLAGLALVAVAFLAVTGGTGSLIAPGGDANIGAGIVLYYGILRLGGGILARTASLAALAAGHPRPWSLWIEVLFYFVTPLLLDRVIGA